MEIEDWGYASVFKTKVKPGVGPVRKCDMAMAISVMAMLGGMSSLLFRKFLYPQQHFYSVACERLYGGIPWIEPNSQL